MTRETFGDYEEDIYGYELRWSETQWNDGESKEVECCQYFLDYEFEKAKEIGQRMKSGGRFSDVKLYFLTEDFKRVFGYRVNLDD